MTSAYFMSDNESDFARQENDTTADIRYGELNGRDAAIDVRCVSAVKIFNCFTQADFAWWTLRSSKDNSE